VTKTENMVWNAEFSGDIEGAAVLVQANHDDVPDPAFGIEDGDFVILDGKTGATLHTIKTDGRSQYKLGHVATAAAIDVNGDGLAEVFAPSRDDHLRALDGATGELLWELDAYSTFHAAPIVVDFDEDGELELVSADVRGHLYVQDPLSGDILWGTKLEKGHVFAPLGWHPEARCLMVGTTQLVSVTMVSGEP
jgi:outer membrane protein assembly factor BamB